MDALDHSVIATGLLALFYYVGVYYGKRKKTEDIVDAMLDKLEAGGYIKVELCEITGEKELITIDKTT